jgi:Cft2 family RNA processing exonuclease
MLKINFYNVEHGSCTHIITPNGKHILIDIGSKTDSSLAAYIKRKYFSYFSNSIDELIITHPHEDHIYDLPQLYTLLRPKVLHHPKNAFDIYPRLNTPIHIRIAEYANKMNREYCSSISSAVLILRLFHRYLMIRKKVT